MSAMASQFTGDLIVYSTVCSGAEKRKHHSHQWIPRTKANDTEHVSIWWRQHENRKYRCRRWVLLHEMWSECSPVEMCFNEWDKLSSERSWERALIPQPSTLGECPHRGDSSPSPTPKNSKVFISLMPCKFWNKTSVIIQTSFSHHINILFVKI